MELGEKLRQARMDAGLSQRQLCGEVITRNMLSLIEHGSAKPSMETLKLLAARLGKPVSYFLDEEVITSPNQSVMGSASRLYDRKEYEEAALVLEGYRAPDGVYDCQKDLLSVLIYLELAEAAIRDGRYPYALELLGKADRETAWCSEELKRRRLLLLGRLPGQQVSVMLPSLDEELLLRAQEAFAAGNLERTMHLLESVEDRNSHWNFLRARVWMESGNFREAALCLHKAEPDFPKETAPLLEHCYRELEDFIRAYEYACKQK